MCSGCIADYIRNTISIRLPAEGAVQQLLLDYPMSDLVRKQAACLEDEDKADGGCAKYPSLSYEF